MTIGKSENGSKIRALSSLMKSEDSTETLRIMKLISSVVEEEERLMIKRLIRSDLKKKMYASPLIQVCSEQLDSVVKEPRKFWLTISPPDSYFPNPALIPIRMKQLFGLKNFLRGTYCIEQRGSDDSTLGNGIHIHCLFESLQYEKARWIKEIALSMK